METHPEVVEYCLQPLASERLSDALQQELAELTGSALIKSGARAGDLLVTTEARAKTVLIRCAATCPVKYIAIGPAVAHIEGHIIFAGRS
jgi:hypothetical protein